MYEFMYVLESRTLVCPINPLMVQNLEWYLLCSICLVNIREIN